ncbi:MAG: filamentous hemagglutinin N-terminal domain-containing protein, partial [Candidatus Pacebacteria bacterium]|nr:filamentous hemagglutinin N-terminal domain-containing protein [Candidatus Paceibacterota bacterium]
MINYSRLTLLSKFIHINTDFNNISPKKQSDRLKPRSHAGVTRLVGSAAVAAVLAFSPHSASAAPIGGSLAAGSASLSTNGLTTTIIQSSDRAVIDWQSFNLAANETVEFKVPTDTSATLNRINDSRPSQISGTVTSNGAVYFTNPNGLVFDATSQVTANGFFAATQNLNQTEFMGRSATAPTLSNLGGAELRLDGTITAPTITALGGMVTVNGTIEASRGTILLSSTNLTTIGATAVISVDAAQNGNGGRAIIWSDNHTDFNGFISAKGGSDSGDGGFVEVSGKHTLNYNGLVNTLANHGKTGTLLLDPTDITISTDPDAATRGSTTITGTAATSVVNITTLQNALASSNVIVDATAGVGTGSGSITVANAVTWTSANSLTLTAGVGGIKINSTISSGTGGLILNSQGMVTIVPGADWTLGGDVTINSAGNTNTVRLDLAGNALHGSKTITATGLNVFYTGATTGNHATIAVGSAGSFTFVNDKRTVTAATTLDNTTTAATATKGWGTGLGTITSGTASASGLTVSGNSANSSANINHQGVVYGGALTINSVGVANPPTRPGGTVPPITGTAQNLRYIEGTSITVATANSTFSGSVQLRSNGAVTIGKTNGLTLTAGGQIVITGTSMTLTSNLVTTSSGAVTIDIGSGTYSNTNSAPSATVGFSLSTSNRNLTFRAGDISQKSGTIFNLKSLNSAAGTFTLLGAIPLSTANDTQYTMNPAFTAFASTAGVTRLTNRAVTSYSFADSNGATASLSSDGTILNLPTSFLAANSLVIGTAMRIRTQGYSAGLGVSSTGTVIWRNQSNNLYDTKISTVFLSPSKAMVIAGVTSAAISTAGLAASTITLSGSNSFSNSVLISASGNITQTGGTITLAAGKVLSLSSINGNISLNQTGNDLKTLGIISAAGLGKTVTIWNSGNLSLASSITVGGAITIDTTKNATGDANGNLTLTRNITTRGGAVTLNLGGGSFVNGTFTLTTTSQNLSLTAGDIANKSSSTIFILGNAGRLTTAGGLNGKSFERDLAKDYSISNSVFSDFNSAEIEGQLINALTYSFADSNLSASVSGTSLNLPGSLLSTNSLVIGTKKKVTSQGHLAGTGLFADAEGNYSWQSFATATNTVWETATSSNVSLSTGMDLVIAGVDSAVTNVTIFDPNNIDFYGTNSFTAASLNLTATGNITQYDGTITVANSLNLTATGNITQNDGTITVANSLSLTATEGYIYQSVGTIAISNGELTLTAGSWIELRQTGNSLRSLGAINSGGTVYIVNDAADLALNGDITAGSWVEIDTTDGRVFHNLTLSKAISFSGGYISINLGKGSLITGGHSINANGNNIYLWADHITASDNQTLISNAGESSTIYKSDYSDWLPNEKTSDPRYTMNAGFSDFGTDTGVTSLTDSTVAIYNFSDANSTATRAYLGRSIYVLNMPTAQLAAGLKIGTLETVKTPGRDAGYEKSGTTYSWRAEVNSIYNSPTDVTLPTGKPMEIKGVTSAATSLDVFAPTTIVFSGTNSFTGNGLSLSSTGSISQTSGTISLASGDLTLSAFGGIDLNRTGNSLGSLGTITNNGGGSLVINNDGGALALNGNIGFSGTLYSPYAVTISTSDGTTSYKLTLKKDITISGGPVSINLGTATYDNDSTHHYLLTTNNQNLTLIAGDIAAKESGVKIFALGLGAIDNGMTGTIQTGILSPGTAETTYSGGYITASNEAGFISTTDYYIVDVVSGKTNDDSHFWIKSDQLTNANLGSKTTVYTGATWTEGLQNKDDHGLKGDIYFVAAQATPQNLTTTEVFALDPRKSVYFNNVNNPLSGATQSLIANNTTGTIYFDGTVSFNQGLTLQTAGAITQWSGTMTVSGGDLSLTATGGISLSQSGNSLGSLGTITNSGGGSISISNLGGDLALNGNIGFSGTLDSSSTYAVSISTSDGTTNHKLTLKKDITISGGSVSIYLGTGALDVGSSHFSIDTSNQNLELTAGSIANIDATKPIFKLKSGVGAAGQLGLWGGVALAGAKNDDATYTGLATSEIAEALKSGTITTYLFRDIATASLVDTTLYLPGSQLATGLKIGTIKTVKTQGVETAGLKEGSTPGEYSWAELSDSIFNDATELNLVTGKEMVISKVTNSTATSVSAFAPSTLSIWDTNSFTGALTLEATGLVSMEGSITTVGALTISGSGLTLTDNLSITGGAVTINLGAGTYNNGTNYSIDANGQNVTLTADHITVADGDSIITDGGTTVTIQKADLTSWYSISNQTDDRYTLNNGFGSFASTDGVDRLKSSTIATYRFADGNSSASISSDGTTLNLSGTQLASGLVIGTKFAAATQGHSAGFRRNVNSYVWRASLDTTFSETATNVELNSLKAIVIAGVTGSTAVNVTAFDPTSITVSGTNSFSGALTLAAQAGVTLGGSITTVGALSISGTGLTLSSNLTTSGGAVTVNLGTGTYTNASYWLDTSNNNLTLKAGSISNTAATVIFKLGSSGTLSFASGSTVGERILRTDATTRYTVSAGYTGVTETNLAAIETNLASITEYSFKNGNTGTITGNSLNLPTAALAASGLVIGTKATVANQGVETAGLMKDGSGNVMWVDTVAASYNTATNISLSQNKAMVIAGVTNSTATSVTNFNPTTITISGSNSFTGALSLTTTSTVSVGGSITTGGALSISASGLTLTNNLTTSGGEVTINLGTGALDVTASHFYLDTSNKNLTLTAGSIANGSTSAIFKLKSDSTKDKGELTLSGTLQKSASQTVSTKYIITNSAFTGLDLAAIDAAAGTITKYSFKDGNNLSLTDSNRTLNLPTAALASSSGQIGTKEIPTVTEGLTAGLKEGSTAGEFTYETGNITYNTATAVNIVQGKAMEIAGVNSAAADVTVYAPSTITFSGTNRFSAGLSLTATAAITQSGGTITLTAGDLTLTAVGGISLNQSGNSLRSLGVITNNTSGNIVIINSAAALAVNGKITGAGGSTTITIDTTGGSHNLTLSKSMESKDGDLILKIGGKYDKNGFTWELNSRKLNLTSNGLLVANNVTDTDSEIFTHVSTAVMGFESNLEPKVASGEFKDTGRNYFTTLTKGSQAYDDAEKELHALDSTAILNPIADMIRPGAAT